MSLEIAIDRIRELRNNRDIEELNLSLLDLENDDLVTLFRDHANVFDRIKDLNLSGNDLTCLPDNIRMNSLKKLDLTGNSFISVPINIDASSLEILVLDGNSIVQLPDDAFSRLPELRKLSLADNGIEIILADAFNNLPNLQYLNLSQNNIQTFPEGFLNPNNIWMCLSHNQITDIPQNINLGGFSYLSLENNPLSEASRDFIDSSGNNNNIFYNMGAFNTQRRRVPSGLGDLDFSYEEEVAQEMNAVFAATHATDVITWRTFFDKLDIKNENKEQIIKEIENNDAIQEFIEKAANSSLYQSAPEIINFGLTYLLEKLASRHEHEKEGVIASMVAHSDACSTPVSELCLQNYLLYLKENIQEIPQGLILKAALMDFILNNVKELKLKPNEVIEQANGLINAVTLYESWLNENNKTRIMHENNEPSNTQYIDFAFQQVREETAEAFTQELCQPQQDKDGYFLLDQKKVANITLAYECKFGLKEDQTEQKYAQLMGVLEKNQITDYSSNGLAKLMNGDKAQIIENIRLLPDQDFQQIIKDLNTEKQLSSDHFPFFNRDNAASSSSVPNPNP